jgi:predicted secreted Zn-dependent protease
MTMMRMTLFTMAGLLAMAVAAQAQTVSRSYSYFSIGGVTLEEIDQELSLRGPKLQATGKRHPGATRMQFSARYTFASTDAWCRLDKAQVTVKAEVILPRWKARARADGDTRVIWDTLNADIRRHEESHVQIAKRHARMLEDALEAIGRKRDCEAVKAEADVLNARILAAHDAEQDRFDRIETINFEKRIMRLLAYRLERIRDGRLPQ